LFSRKFNSLVVGLLFFLAGLIPAARGGEFDGDISGQIRDAENGKPIPYANVILVGTGRGAASDDEGRFSIPNVRPGTYEIRIRVIGYRTVVRKITVESGRELQLQVSMVPQAIELPPIETKAKREALAPEISISTRTLSGAELQAAVPVVEPDLFRTIQMLPGVTGSSDFSSEFYVRGGAANQNLILLDGATIYNPYHLFGFFSTFNPMAVDDVELLLGGFPARYGGRASSVLNVRNKEGDKKAYHATVNVNMLTTNILAEGPLPRGSFCIAGRRTYQGWLGFLKQIKYYRTKKDFDPYTPNYDAFNIPDYHFYDLQGKLSLDPWPEHSFNLSGYWNRDVLSNLHQADEYEVFDVHRTQLRDIDVGWGNSALSLNWMWTPRPEFWWRLNLSGSAFGTEMYLFDNMVVPSRFRVNNDIYNYNGRLDVMFKPVDMFHFRGGLALENSLFTYKLKSEGQNLIDGRRNLVTGSGYLEFIQNLGALLTLQEGIRLDNADIRPNPRPDVHSYIFPDHTMELRHFRPGTHKTVSPRLSLEYKLTPKTSLMAAWGKYYQILETIPFHDESTTLLDIWFPRDKKYPPLKAEHYIVGIRRWLPQGFTFSIEAYYKDLFNLMDLNDFYYPDRIETYFRKGRGIARGIDILLRQSTRRTYTWIGYSYSHVRGYFDDIAYNLRHDRRHTVNMVLHWFSFDRKWEFSINWTYSSGLPYTEIIGKYRVPNVDGYYGHTYPVDMQFEWKSYSTGKNRANYPAYHRMDFSLIRRIDWGKYRFEPYFQFVNVYNQNNVFFYRRHAYYLNQRTRVSELPAMPMLGLKVRF